MSTKTTGSASKHLITPECCPESKEMIGLKARHASISHAPLDRTQNPTSTAGFFFKWMYAPGEQRLVAAVRRVSSAETQSIPAPPSALIPASTGPYIHTITVVQEVRTILSIGKHVSVTKAPPGHNPRTMLYIDERGRSVQANVSSCRAWNLAAFAFLFPFID